MPRVFDPHSGGVKVPRLVQERIRRRIVNHADKKYAGRFTRLDNSGQFRSAPRKGSATRMTPEVSPDESSQGVNGSESCASIQAEAKDNFG